MASDLDPYEAIRQGEDGIKVEETPEAWADAISELVADEEKRRHIGSQSRLRLLKDYDVRKRAGEWTAVYDMVCNGS